MYAVIGVIAVFLVIAVIILLGRGSRDTGQGTTESPDVNDWNSGMEETDPGYLAEPEKPDGEPEADTDVQEESKPKETEEAMEPAEEKEIPEETIPRQRTTELPAENIPRQKR